MNKKKIIGFIVASLLLSCTIAFSNYFINTHIKEVNLDVSKLQEIKDTTEIFVKTVSVKSEQEKFMVEGVINVNSDRLSELLIDTYLYSRETKKSLKMQTFTGMVSDYDTIIDPRLSSTAGGYYSSIPLAKIDYNSTYDIYVVYHDNLRDIYVKLDYFLDKGSIQQYVNSKEQILEVISND